MHERAEVVHAGKYVKFQPRHAAFQKAAGDDVSGVLEAALAAHSCLSTGDWLRVAAGEGAPLHDLQVLELRPGAAVSVIGIIPSHPSSHLRLARLQYCLTCACAAVTYGALWLRCGGIAVIGLICAVNDARHARCSPFEAAL